MSNKRVGVAAAAALAVAAVAYGGGTWFLGQRTQDNYQEAVAELRKALGSDVVVTDEYHKGFLSSQARLTLQWTPKTDTAAGPPPQPVRLVVDSAVRHGPWAGARLAAAVVDSRFALQGLDAQTLSRLGKASAPTLTTVHRLTGGHDIHFVLPAGEMGDDEVTVSWQEMVYDMGIGRKGQSLQGTFRMPELAIAGLPDSKARRLGVEEEENDMDEAGGEAQDAAEAAMAALPSDRTTMSIQGVEGRFDNAVIDGLWGIGPGTASFRVARAHASVTPGAGGETKALLDVKDILGSYAIDSTGTTLGMRSQVKAAGRIGPIDFESIGFEEKIQRISIEAIRNVQRVVLDAYRAGGAAQAATALEEQGARLLEDNAPRLVAALPAYSMKVQATYLGKTGELEYGGEVQKAPSEAEMAQTGWKPALIKGAVLHAGARLPKAWVLPLMQSTGKPDVKPQEVDAMVGMAQSAGYLRQEGELLTSSVKLESGQLVLNGKTMPLPGGLFR